LNEDFCFFVFSSGAVQSLAKKSALKTTTLNISK